MSDDIRKLFDDSAELIRRCGDCLAGDIRRASEMIVDALRSGGAVFIFGNGGSAADAQHIAAELAGRFRRDRAALRAEALTTDASAITAIGNDLGFDQVFARQLAGKAAAGDVAMAISTSGNSPNILTGLEAAKQIGMTCIALTGRGGGKCAPLADVLLAVPSDDTPRVQESHEVIYHVLCELVESAMAQ